MKDPDDISNREQRGTFGIITVMYWLVSLYDSLEDFKFCKIFVNLSICIYKTHTCLHITFCLFDSDGKDPLTLFHCLMGSRIIAFENSFDSQELEKCTLLESEGFCVRNIIH